MQTDEINEVDTSAERRDSDRVKLIVDVNFEGGEATGIANTRDIGIGGLYMSTAAKLAVGDKLRMRMTIGHEPHDIRGIVVYSDPGSGVGVRFMELSEDSKIALQNNLDLN
jgi:hypothetical protein